MPRAFCALVLLCSIAGSPFALEPGPLVTTGEVTVCFTSGKGSTEGADCGAVVVSEIEAARESLLVQAYNFTEPRIIAAIVAAHARGVAVTVILDKTSPAEKGEGADRVRDSGIPVYIDRRPRIAHNKVMVIDDRTVVTGSFNFSISATCCNAENLLVLRSPELAAAYAANFARRLEVSVAYTGASYPAARRF